MTEFEISEFEQQLVLGDRNKGKVVFSTRGQKTKTIPTNFWKTKSEVDKKKKQKCKEKKLAGIAKPNN